MGERPKLRPVVWDPPPPPPRARSDRGSEPLPPVRTIALDGDGPEDVVIDTSGGIITGVGDGRILRIDPDGLEIRTVADTGGRPMGIELLGDELIVCDCRQGLLVVEPASGRVRVLVDVVDGEPLLHCNNAAVADDGTIYFSDSSRRFGFDHYRADLLEHSGTGRVLRRDPDGAVDVIIDGLQFANGVALLPGGSALVVAETAAYRLTRISLTTSRAGQAEPFIDNLPGFPDNLSIGTDGLLWIALPSDRNRMLDRLLRIHPLWRKAVWATPERLQPHGSKTLWVMAVDAEGRLVHDIQASIGAFHMVTGVRESEAKVYLASLEGRAIGVLDLADAR